MSKKLKKKVGHASLPAKLIFFIILIAGIILLSYPLLDLSCQQPLSNGESKAEALYRSVCTIPLGSIVLFGLGLIFFITGVIYFRH